jgi:hypothetical protein
MAINEHQHVRRVPVTMACPQVADVGDSLWICRVAAVMNPDVSGLTKLHWPSGSVIIQVMALSDGWWNVCSNHREQFLTTELRGFIYLNEYYIQMLADLKSGQPSLSNRPRQNAPPTLLSIPFKSQN